MKPDDDKLLDRKTKRKLEDKMFKKNQLHSLKTAYRKKRRVEYAIKKEEELLNEHKKYVEGLEEQDPDANDKSPIFSISIAVPGSLLNNAQSAELRTYMAGQIARTATLFNVEDIIIYDETAKMRQEDIDGYYSGSWYGDIIPSDKNFESCFYLAKILEYVECPQYLRKQLFPKQRSLKFAGLLNPLDAHHHLKSDDLSIPYREGVVLNKPPKDGHGLYCDIGLDKEFQLEEQVDLPANTRVTVKINNLTDAKRKFRGSLTSPKEVRKATGLYWGYSVNFATSLKDIIADGKYDYVLGTSPRGKSVNDLMISTLQRIRVLVVFGGVQGVDVVFEREENWEYKTAEEAFTDLINCLPNKGSSTERVEESIMVTLSELSLRLQQLS